ncbi:MAG TPA: helix-turn-helix domain-containing protein [Candidatus Dormibacteraeota bacterium]|nr:helix-turn-helix domain-containing protein [Candidatus Dormibacteraeota bacterium]
MQGQPDDSLTKIYNALANPVRRRIIAILKEKGKAGFKELHDTLKISVGALYHHLDNLEGLIDQGPDKKYFLTDRGKTAISALSASEEKIISGSTQSPLNESRLAFFSRELLFGRTLLNYLNQDPIRSLPLAAIVLILGGVISFRTNLEPILLFYLNPTPGIGQAWFLLLFPLGWFITFGVADLLCYLFFHRSGGELSLLNGTALSMLPLLLVPGLILLIEPFSTIIRSVTVLTILIQVAVQVWVVCLLSSAISIAKGLRMERTALVSLAVMYLNITAVIFALQLGLF